MSILKLNKQRGMTLLEVIIVLGIMGVIAAGVVVLAQRAIDNQNVTNLTNMVNTIQTAMVQTYRGKGFYPVVNSPELAVQLGQALVSMGRISESDLVNPFNGTPVSIYTTAFNGLANKAYGVGLTELTQDQCRAMVSSVSDFFEFVQVGTAGTAIVADISSPAVAGSTTGIMKSPGGGTQFDTTQLDHVTNLCGGAAGANAYYDLYLGGR